MVYRPFEKKYFSLPTFSKTLEQLPDSPTFIDWSHYRC